MCVKIVQKATRENFFETQWRIDAHGKIAINVIQTMAMVIIKSVKSKM